MYSPHSPELNGEHHSFASSSVRGHSPTSHHLNLNHNYSAQHNYSQNHNQNHQLQHQFSASPANSYSTSTTTSQHAVSAHHLSSMSAAAAAAAAAAASSSKSIQCLRFKYFTTFFVCTTCLVLLSASLATHKWLVSRPVRILRLNNGQLTNFTALMLSADADQPSSARQRQSRLHINQREAASETQQQQQQQQPPRQQASDMFSMEAAGSTTNGAQQGNKFQGEIYFGLFNGVKVLNYGFGDRISQVSVLHPSHSNGAGARPMTNGAEQTPTTTTIGQSQHELVNFKLWLTTLAGVVLAMLFALIGSIFAIINFVMTPRGTITGPVGLVIWNAAASFACLLAMFAWLVEYFVRLKGNVLTPEEVQNGWTSENRSQFGYSYYFVVLAFVLHLVNIFIVSIVQAETWTNHSSKAAAKRQSRAAACEGVIMLY